MLLGTASRIQQLGASGRADLHRAGRAGGAAVHCFWGLATMRVRPGGPKVHRARRAGGAAGRGGRRRAALRRGLHPGRAPRRRARAVWQHHGCVLRERWGRLRDACAQR